VRRLQVLDHAADVAFLFHDLLNLNLFHFALIGSLEREFRSLEPTLNHISLLVAQIALLPIELLHSLTTLNEFELRRVSTDIFSVR